MSKKKENQLNDNNVVVENEKVTIKAKENKESKEKKKKNIEPIFQIGKSSLTPEVTEAVLESFNNRELIKISVLKNRKDKKL